MYLRIIICYFQLMVFNWFQWLTFLSGNNFVEINISMSGRNHHCRNKSLVYQFFIHWKYICYVGASNDFKRHRAHYDFIVMKRVVSFWTVCIQCTLLHKWETNSTILRIHKILYVDTMLFALTNITTTYIYIYYLKITLIYFHKKSMHL